MKNVAIVTEAARGIGKAVAKRLAKDGFGLFTMRAAHRKPRMSFRRSEPKVEKQWQFDHLFDHLFAQTLIHASEPTASFCKASLFAPNPVAAKHQQCYTGGRWAR